MFHFMQPPSSSISWKPAWHSLLVSLPDPGIRQTFLQQAVMFLHALLSRRSHIPSSGQTASSQSEIALLCGASAVTRFSPDVPETERGESSQAWPIRWCSADSHDANCNLQYFTSFVTIAGPGELGHRGLLCKTSGCLPLALASLGRRAKLCFGGILGLTPDILTFCISHQETTDLFLIFFFFSPLTPRLTLGDCLQEALPTRGNVVVVSQSPPGGYHLRSLLCQQVTGPFLCWAEPSVLHQTTPRIKPVKQGAKGDFVLNTLQSLVSKVELHRTN